jgi:hypothetical protein
MPILPNSQAMLSTTKVMTKTLMDLHKIIEQECNYKRPKEAMVLMMAFINGIVFQLRDKVETLESGLGKQLLEAVNALTSPGNADTLDKLNRNDPSLAKSVSGIAPEDLPKAISFLTNRLFGDIKMHLEELPLLLRNDDTLLNSLAFVVARILNAYDHNNLDTYIENFSGNIRVFANEDEKEERSGAYPFIRTIR